MTFQIKLPVPHIRNVNPPDRRLRDGRWRCQMGAILTVLTIAFAPTRVNAAANRLLTECYQNGVSLSLRYSTVAANPGAYRGRELVVAGSILRTWQHNGLNVYRLTMSSGQQIAMRSATPSNFDAGADVVAIIAVPLDWKPGAQVVLIDMDSQANAHALLSTLGETPAPAQPWAPHAPPGSRAGGRSRYGSSAESSRAYSDIFVGARRRLLTQYAQAVRYFNPKISMDDARTIAGHVIWYSQAYGVDARLVMAIIEAESEFHADSVSNHGAMGLGQLMPGTARDLGVSNAFDPEQNISGAIRLIHYHLEQYQNNPQQLELALACYNAGENAVKRYHGVPPFHETQRYVEKVSGLYYQMCRGSIPRPLLH